MGGLKMIKQRSSEEIRRINNRNDEKELTVLNWLKTILAGFGLTAIVWLFLGIFGGGAAR